MTTQVHFEYGQWWLFDRTRLVAGPFATKAEAESRLIWDRCRNWHRHDVRLLGQNQSSEQVLVKRDLQNHRPDNHEATDKAGPKTA